MSTAASGSPWLVRLGYTTIQLSPISQGRLGVKGKMKIPAARDGMIRFVAYHFRAYGWLEHFSIDKADGFDLMRIQSNRGGLTMVNNIIERCRTCDGTGNGKEKCEDCKGIGELPDKSQCPSCHGRRWKECGTCKGLGHKELVPPKKWKDTEDFMNLESRREERT